MQFCKIICISVLFLAKMVPNFAIASEDEVSILNIDEIIKQRMEFDSANATTDSQLHSEKNLVNINTNGSSSRQLELDIVCNDNSTGKSGRVPKYNAGNPGHYIVNRTNVNQIILIAGNIAKYGTCDVYSEAEFAYGTLITFPVIITVCRHSLNSIESILSQCKNYLNNIDIRHHFEAILNWAEDCVTGEFKENYYYDEFNHQWKKLDKSATASEIEALDIALID